MQDLGYLQDNDAEKDLKQSDGGSGQDAPDCRCVHEYHLLESWECL